MAPITLKYSRSVFQNRRIGIIDETIWEQIIYYISIHVSQFIKDRVFNLPGRPESQLIDIKNYNPIEKKNCGWNIPCCYRPACVIMSLLRESLNHVDMDIMQ